MIQIVNNKFSPSYRPTPLREHDTLNHLLVLPLTALEIMLAIPVIIPMQLLSGGSTPLDSMPQWLQWVMQGSPSTHFVSLSAAILFRDAGVSVVWPDLLALARFRKSLAP